jgi:hypothetical protein
MVLDFVQTIENNVPDCKILKLVLDIVYCDRENKGPSFYYDGKLYSLTRIIVLYCQKDWSTTSLVNEQKPLCLQPYEHSIIQPLNVSRRNKRMVPYSLSITINNIQHQF